MATQVDTIQSLKNYFELVMGKADHHAHNVNEVSLAIVGAIIWKAESDSIQFLTRDGESKNVLWAVFSGQKLCFVYNHNNQSIDVKERTLQGAVIKRFTNADSPADIKQWFNSL